MQQLATRSRCALETRSCSLTSELRPCLKPYRHLGNRRLNCRVQGIAEEVSSIAPSITVTGAAVATGLGFAIWKLTTYSQLEYITASMLTNYVPKDGQGARIIQLNGGTRELYYYPKNVFQVTVVGENINKSLLEQAGMQAAVPTVAKVQSPANLGFQGANTADAIVSLGALASMSVLQRNMFVQEALRVLKPGRPIIFLEKVAGGLFLRQLGSPGPTLDVNVLEGLKANKAFELVQWDVALEGQDPHAVGVAIKSEAYVPDVPSRREQRENARKAPKEPKPQKGFNAAKPN